MDPNPIYKGQIELNQVAGQYDGYKEANRESAQAVADRRADELYNEAALYQWLNVVMAKDPPSPTVEKQLYNLLISVGRLNRY